MPIHKVNYLVSTVCMTFTARLKRANLSSHSYVGSLTMTSSLLQCIVSTRKRWTYSNTHFFEWAPCYGTRGQRQNIT